MKKKVTRRLQDICGGNKKTHSFRVSWVTDLGYEDAEENLRQILIDAVDDYEPNAMGVSPLENIWVSRYRRTPKKVKK